MNSLIIQRVFRDWVLILIWFEVFSFVIISFFEVNIFKNYRLIHGICKDFYINYVEIIDYRIFFEVLSNFHCSCIIVGIWSRFVKFLEILCLYEISFNTQIPSFLYGIIIFKVEERSDELWRNLGKFYEFIPKLEDLIGY